MSCVNCQASTNVPPGGLTPDDICNGKYITSDCVIYTGVALSTIDIENGDTFTTIVNNINNVVNNILAIIPFKQTLSALQCDTLSTVPVDITDLPAPGAGFAWELLSVTVKYIFNTVDYDFASIYIATDGIPGAQGYYNYAATAASEGIISRGLIVDATLSQQDATVIDNAKMVVFSNADPTVGDGSFVIYGTARLIEL